MGVASVRVGGGVSQRGGVQWGGHNGGLHLNAGRWTWAVQCPSLNPQRCLFLKGSRVEGDETSGTAVHRRLRRTNGLMKPLSL